MFIGKLWNRAVVLGGDPTGTGNGGESIYGRPFKDEIHSRLRFTHRGLVACANRNEPHTNGSQFFITLDATPQIDRKYTIFGRVAGSAWLFVQATLGEGSTIEIHAAYESQTRLDL